MEFVTFEDYNDHLRECIEKGSGFVFITQEMVDLWKSKTTARKEKRREASKQNGCEHLEECVDEVSKTGAPSRPKRAAALVAEQRVPVMANSDAKQSPPEKKKKKTGRFTLEEYKTVVLENIKQEGSSAEEDLPFTLGLKTKDSFQNLGKVFKDFNVVIRRNAYGNMLMFMRLGEILTEVKDQFEKEFWIGGRPSWEKYYKRMKLRNNKLASYTQEQKYRAAFNKFSKYPSLIHYVSNLDDITPTAAIIKQYIRTDPSSADYFEKHVSEWK